MSRLPLFGEASLELTKKGELKQIKHVAKKK
jgi:hypothetical protein